MNPYFLVPILSSLLLQPDQLILNPTASPFIQDSVAATNVDGIKSAGNKGMQFGSKQQTSNRTYRLVVSFYSIGTGIDTSTKEQFQAFLKTNYPNIAYEEIRWGFEGEVNYCLLLKELSPRQQRKFIEAAKKQLNNSDRVNVYENKKCMQKRAN